MASGYKNRSGTISAYLEYWASRLLADTTDYTWWNLYMKDCTDRTITAFGLRGIGRGWSNVGQPEARIYGSRKRGPPQSRILEFQRTWHNVTGRREFCASIRDLCSSASRSSYSRLLSARLPKPKPR